MKPKMPEHISPAEMEPEVDPADLEAATDESTMEEGPAELLQSTEKLTEWDQPPGRAGTEVPKVKPDDESTVGQQLVKEGLEEADRDQRIAAADPDFEP
jgi:hypothetical protein